MLIYFAFTLSLFSSCSYKDFMFYNDYNLQKVELSSSVTCIMSNVFGYCDALRLRLPSSLKYIEYNSFNGCTGTAIEVPSSKKEWLLSILEDYRGSIEEYYSDKDYVESSLIADRTEKFLNLHKAKKQIFEEEFMESLGIRPRYEDEFMLLDDF